ncbi:M81 family metallopeptidase [Phytoactinopolyspora halotolerans]|uniref:M81 family metallopeptidase n=1 Tax=Phytoactinopolyspora halotolerans TaxID=1981512 RepID=A0A6L9SBD3_9ACTN|nr:M81 family metallopeptidase [Phytoactinopolyspora halotolerans]NEE01892.1 M81 family metallopeptidase [Phytoactinopolyspora halotolerans]
MRLATLGFNHESNTFAPGRATLQAWHEAGITEGEQIRAIYAESDSTLAGFFAYGAEQPEAEVVPLVFAWLTPAGASTAEAYDHLTARMLDALAAQGPFDGVLLALHGAAVAENARDADGDFVRRVRDLIGGDVPLGVTVDMHANISRQFVDHADVVTVYQTNPHVDAAKQGLACARILGAAVRGEIRPVTALADPPLAVNILRQGTGDEPMASLLALAREQEQRPGVLSTSVVEGFPYADVAEMGMTFVAVTDDDASLAADVARVLADAAWTVRDRLDADLTPVDDALRQAEAAESGPVLLMDMGDNVGGGSPGDSTHVLHAARRLGVTGLIMSINDAQAVAACTDAEVGGRVELDVGGRTDHRHGEPFPVAGEVIALTDGRFEDPTPTHGGARYYDLGPSAGLRTDDGFLLAIHSRPAGTASREQFRMVGIDPTAAKIIAAKGVHSPRAAFEPIAARLIWANTPGCTTADLSLLDHRHRRRPMFPFEPDAGWNG